MRDLRTLRWSFIWRLRLRSTAMWVMRWFSTSSLFLVGLVRFRFLRSRVTAGRDLEKWVCLLDQDCCGLVLQGGGEPAELLSMQCFSDELGFSWLHSELIPSRHEVECGC